MLTIERLKEVLEYEPATGSFKWIKLPSKFARIRVGDIAGTINSHGYNVIKLDKKIYAAHRLAWFYVNQEWPSNVDHKDTHRANNKWDNLRLATTSQNAYNRGCQKNNTTGFKGVFAQKKQFEARIRVQGKAIYLGLRNTKEEAFALYEAAAKRYHGEFARPSL